MHYTMDYKKLKQLSMTRKMNKKVFLLKKNRYNHIELSHNLSGGCCNTWTNGHTNKHTHRYKTFTRYKAFIHTPLS